MIAPISVFKNIPGLLDTFILRSADRAASQYIYLSI